MTPRGSSSHRNPKARKGTRCHQKDTSAAVDMAAYFAGGIHGHAEGGANLVLEPLPNGELAWLKPCEEPAEDDDALYMITGEGPLSLRMAELFGTTWMATELTARQANVPESWQAVLGILPGRDDDQIGDHGDVHSMEEPGAMSPADVVLPIERIHRNPGQPRTNFDRNGLSELAESIRQHGLLQPVVVRPKGEIYDRSLLVSDAGGRRNWQGWPRSNVGSYAASMTKHLSFWQSPRTSTCATWIPIDEAKSYARVLAIVGSVEEVAKLVRQRGKKPSNTASTC